MRILVTGATGFLGTHLGRELRRNDKPFAVFVRSLRKARLYQEAGVEICPGDLLDVSSCERATRGRDVVVHLAAAADVSDPRVNQRVNVEGLANLLAACRASGVGRFVFVSSTCAGRERRDAYGETKLQGEELVKRSGLAFAILRPTMIYGPGSQEFETFVRVIRSSPIVPLIGSGKSVIQPVYVGDALRVLLAVTESAAGLGKTYDLAGATPVTFDDFVQLIARTLGLRRRTLLHVPARPVLFAARLLGRALTHVPISVDQVLAFLQDTRVDIEPLRRDLGFVPRALDEGLALALTGGA